MPRVSKMLLPIMLFLVAELGYAGCPSLPPVTVNVKIADCKVYSFEDDVAYWESFQEQINKFSEKEIKRFKASVLNSLNGVILDVDIISPNALESVSTNEITQLFYRHKGAEFCAQMTQNKHETFSINRSCPMFRFDVPAGIRWYVVDDTVAEETQDAGDDVPKRVHDSAAEQQNTAIKKGLTWAKHSSDAVTGVITVGCGHTPETGNQCNGYNGDTSCDTKLPVLCFLDAGLPKPPLIAIPSRYQSWSGGIVGTTSPVAGNEFQTIHDVNAFCQEAFGKEWRVAEHHDGWGWYFKAFGGIGSTLETEGTRFWVDVNDQPNGTCWARTR